VITPKHQAGGAVCSSVLALSLAIIVSMKAHIAIDASDPGTVSTMTVDTEKKELIGRISSSSAWTASYGFVRQSTRAAVDSQRNKWSASIESEIKVCGD
jgi:hypothetical protein